MPANKKLIWTLPAREDIIRLREFIEPHNPEAAHRAAENLKKAALLLLENPHIGKPVERMEYRELIVPIGRRGYVIRYRVMGDEIIILRVWHGLEEKGTT